MSPVLKRVVFGVSSGLLSFSLITSSAAGNVELEPLETTTTSAEGLLPPYNLPMLAKLQEPSELSNPKDFYSRLVEDAEELSEKEEAARKAEVARKAKAEKKAKEEKEAKERAAKAAKEKEAARVAQAAKDRVSSPAPSRTSDRGTPGMSCAAPSGDGSLNPWVAKVRTRISEQFGVSNIGGTRPGDPQDHGNGLALDVMVPVGSDLGDSVAAWAVENHSALAIKYVIWEQRIWNPSVSGSWRLMEDRGSITQNHFDHVHLSFTGATGSCP